MSASPYRPVVLSILRAHGAKSVLDAPCGQGWLAQAVQAGRIRIDTLDGVEMYDFPEDPSLPYRKVDAYDLDKPLPDPDQPYDAVVCAEAIHLVTNPGVVLESFKRALRPGSIVVITTPNTWYMRSRLQFLLRGFHSGFRPGIGKQPGKDYITYFPWTYPQLHLLLTHYGYTGVTLHEVDERKPKRWVEHALALPSKLYYGRCRRRAATPEETEYWATAGRAQSLHGRWLVVSARKPG